MRSAVNKGRQLTKVDGQGLTTAMRPLNQQHNVKSNLEGKSVTNNTTTPYTKAKDQPAEQKLTDNKTYQREARGLETHNLRPKFLSPEERRLENYSNDISKPQGFQNLGNTCYMNSGLQCLLNSKYLRQLLEKGGLKLNNQNKDLALKFKSLMSDYHCDKFSQLNQSLRDFRKQLIDCFPMFRGYNQHDASEFLSNLIQGLNEQIIDDQMPGIFYGTNQINVECDNCRNEKSNESPSFEDFSIISLQGCRSDNLQAKINETEKENYHMVDWYCQLCKKFTGALYSKQVKKYPQVLQIQVKRFYARDLYESSYNSRSSKGLPQSLSLSNQNYRLFGIINHVGDHRGGHYTAEIKKENVFFFYQSLGLMVFMQRFNSDKSRFQVSGLKRLSIVLRKVKQMKAYEFEERFHSDLNQQTYQVYYLSSLSQLWILAKFRPLIQIFFQQGQGWLLLIRKVTQSEVKKKCSGILIIYFRGDYCNPNKYIAIQMDCEYLKQLVQNQNRDFAYQEGQLFYHILSKNSYEQVLASNTAMEQEICLNEDLIDRMDKIKYAYSPQDFYCNTWLNEGLKNELDYIIINQEIWEYLAKFFKGIPIIRKAYGQPPDRFLAVNLLKIEYLELSPDIINSIKDLKHEPQQKYIQIDRYLTHAAFYKLLNVPQQNIRLWVSKENSETVIKSIKENKNPFHKLKGDFIDKDEPHNLLEKLGIATTDLLIIEQTQTTFWCIAHPTVSRNGKCTECWQSTLLPYLCECKSVAYCSEYCKKKDERYHSQRCYKVTEMGLKQLEQTQNSRLGVVGLGNLGNTCFMNSGLQCLQNTIPLTQYFLQNQYFDEINADNPLGTGGNLVREYGALVKRMRYGTNDVITPSQLKYSIGQFQPMFSGYQQHDSSELITFVLDGIHEDLNKVKKKPYISAKDYDGRPDFIIAKERWENHIARNQSIIVDLMHGQYKTEIRCNKCDNMDITFDPFLMLPLSIPYLINKRGSLTLIDLLDHAKKPEQLQYNNTWFCARCKEQVHAFISMQIYKAPKILIVHLKRFSQEGRYKTKLETLIDFPIKDLDLTNYVINTNQPKDYQTETLEKNGEKERKKLVYELYATSNHSGGLGGGHYTAYGKNNGTWYHYNDSSVSRASESYLVSSQAYVLFYQLKEQN